MKRYLTFIGAVCCPSGGMFDFKGDFDTLEKDILFIEKKVLMRVNITKLLNINGNKLGSMFGTLKPAVKYGVSKFYYL